MEVYFLISDVPWKAGHYIFFLSGGAVKGSIAVGQCRQFPPPVQQLCPQPGRLTVHISIWMISQVVTNEHATICAKLRFGDSSRQVWSSKWSSSHTKNLTSLRLLGTMPRSWKWLSSFAFLKCGDMNIGDICTGAFLSLDYFSRAKRAASTTIESTGRLLDWNTPQEKGSEINCKHFLGVASTCRASALTSDSTWNTTCSFRTDFSK